MIMSPYIRNKAHPIKVLHDAQILPGSFGAAVVEESLPV